MTKFSMEGNFGVAGYQQIWHRENKRHHTKDKFFKEYSNRRVLIRAIAFYYISTTERNKTSHSNICNSMITWHVFRTLSSELPSVLHGVHTHTHTHTLCVCVCMYIYIYIYIYIRIYTGLFISPSGISDLCGTVAGVVTPKGNMSTEGEKLHIAVLTSYRRSICTPLVTRQMSIF